jgi:hypothetical protein
MSESPGDPHLQASDHHCEPRRWKTSRRKLSSGDQTCKNHCNAYANLFGDEVGVSGASAQECSVACGGRLRARRRRRRGCDGPSRPFRTYRAPRRPRDHRGRSPFEAGEIGACSPRTVESLEQAGSRCCRSGLGSREGRTNPQACPQQLLGHRIVRENSNSGHP